ncbi:MAG: hypothetical protein ACXAC7_14860 [Candidatus Hodarchaeales archaeon]
MSIKEEKNLNLFNFVEMEEIILNKWNEINLFNLIQIKNKDKPNHVFLEGPPTAIGMNL